MAAPTVASTTPLTGATTVDPRASLTAVFSVALLASSVNRATIYIYESATGRPVDVDVSLSTNGLTVTVTPRGALKENTNYRWALVGQDIGSPGGFIKASDGDALAVTYSVTFRTTVEGYVPLTEVADRTKIEIIGPIRSTEDEAAVSDYISPTSYTPAAFAANQSRSLTTIEVDFGESVSLVGSDPALTVSMQPSDGYSRDYGQEDADGKFLRRDLEDTDTARLALFTEPSGTVTASGTKLIWTKGAGFTWPYNAEITVRIHSGRVQNSSSETLEEDLYFMFTTAYWPVYASPLAMRIEMGPSIRSLYDDTIYRHILKNSIRAILESGDHLGPSDSRDNVYGNVEKFVRAQSAIDLVAELRLLADIQAGQKKQLGDFLVQYSASDPMLGIKLREATGDRDRALRELRRYRGGGPISAIRSEDFLGERSDFRTRTWDSLVSTALPFANTDADMRARRALRTDHQNLSASSVRLVVSDDQEVLVQGSQGVSIIRW